MSRKYASTALCALTAAALGAPALAGGLPKDDSSLKDTDYAAPALVWTGLYVGLHGGYGWADWDGPLSYDDYDKHLDKDFDASDRNIEGDDWLAGVQIGANIQSDRMVYGFEIDYARTGIEGSGSFLPYPDNPGSPAWDIETEMTSFGTVRARLGFLPKETLLLYATGGVAWGNVEADIEPVYSDGHVSAHGDTDETHIGWTVGGGAEWMIADNWSIKGEYLYFDLGEEDYAFTGEKKTGAAYDTDHYHPDLDFHTIRIGINYKLTD